MNLDLQRRLELTLYDTHTTEPMVAQNRFIRREPRHAPRRTFAAVRDELPAPFWDRHDTTIAAFWKAWDVAFGNLRSATPQNGFVSDFIDTAFNQCIFMWDSAFIMMFTKYAAHCFPFIGTLDNFYAKQHKDGFICREISWTKGADRFHRFDPTSTGPAILPWAEWEYFETFGDKKRLADVFAPLVGFHRWLRRYRTWQDGSYWSSGLGCGMDNQRRIRSSDEHDFNYWHGTMSWIDTTAQQLFSARLLCRMAAILDRSADVADCATEAKQLGSLINATMWNHRTRFYHDRYRDRSLCPSKGIGAYWTLLAGAVPPNRLAAFIAHLENPREFNRTHRVPSLSADDPHYARGGQYWLGAVWSPTNYMVLRGLTACGRDRLAHEIGLNHVAAVVASFEKTGTFWENYAPESRAKGNVAKADFVGWTGLSPITVLFEYVFGLRPNCSRNQLVWDVRLTDRHGVTRYPFGRKGFVDLLCEKRTSVLDKPAITIKSNTDFTLEIRWDGGRELRRIKPD